MSGKGRGMAVLAALLLPSALFADFYVSPNGSDSNAGTLAAPFLSVEKARQAVRGVRAGMSADLTVYLRGGSYPLSSTLAFDSGDSGANGYNVVYQAYPGETPVLSGGRAITGWTSAGGGVYRAATGGLRFRQLYVNGSRAVRARTPNAGSYYNVRLWVGADWAADGADRHIEINEGEIASWGQLDKVEMVISKEWVEDRLRIASFSKQGGVARVYVRDASKAFGGHCYLREPSDQNCLSWRAPVNDPYYFENAREFLDQPGEFYMDEAAGQVYYMPRAGEDMASVSAVAPQLERLVQVQGSPYNPARNIRFYGLGLEHSTWLEPSDYGFATRQGDAISANGGGSGYIPAAVRVQDAEGIRFERNRLRSLGATAVSFWSGVHDSALVGNVIEDAAGSGVTVGMDLVGNPSDAWQTCRNNRIENNYVHRTALDYRSSLGLFAGYTDGLVVQHNEVAEVSYTGISSGWGWTANTTALRNNNISYNKVHNVMTMMADGGGIYTLSKQPGSVVAENHIYNVVRGNYAGSFPLRGIYMDEQSDLFTVRDNVIENVSGGWVENFGTNNIGPNNTISNNSGYSQSVVNNAGITAAYQDILTGGTAPPPPPPPLPPPPSSPGLVAHYSMDSAAITGGSLADASGNGHLAAISGPVAVPGRVAEALSFDGSDDIVETDSRILSGLSALSIALWVRPTVAGGRLATNHLACGNYESVQLSADSFIINPANSGSSAQTLGFSNPASGSWSHLAATWDGAAMRVYVNGAMAAGPMAAPSAPHNPASAMTVGGVKQATADCWGAGTGPVAGEFSGLIDDLRIYNYALTAAEVAQLRAGGQAGATCDANGDGSTNVVDVQLSVNQALGASACASDINKDGMCNVMDVQRVVNAALGGACVTGL